MSKQISQYIKNNTTTVKSLVSANGLANEVDRLNSLFPQDKINISKLSDIISYVSEVVEKSELLWRLTLPQFSEYQTIINYIKQHRHIVLKYVEIVGYRDLADELMRLSGDRTNYSKLSNIINYIKETND